MPTMFEQSMRMEAEEQANRSETQDLQFQDYVKPWMLACFGQEIADNVIERSHRFLEESLELVQAKGCTRSEAHQLVDYVFDRPVGEPHQEVGSVMVTLAALCLAAGLDMHKAGSDELKRVWEKKDQIRAKQASKPKNSPLPQHVTRQPHKTAEPTLSTSHIERCAKAFEHGYSTVDGRRAAAIMRELAADRDSYQVEAARYNWLRSRDLDTISQGGVFAGMTPENVILNEEDLDRAIDAAMNSN